jgi:uncharacterized protein with von Willebrand factor type A (vWA) domain
MKWHVGVWLVAAAVAVTAQEPKPEQPAVRRDRAPMTDEQKVQMEARLNNAWQQLPLREKMLLMKMQGALREMPAEERKFIHERIERFINMSPEEREKLKQNHDRWSQMTAEEREKARQEYAKRREAFLEKWRKEHPGEEPPQFNAGASAIRCEAE